MRLLTITTTDMGEPGTRRLDMTQLPDGLIGIEGPNGTGKTTLLELACPGAIYRRLPSRNPGKLIALAKSRKASVEAVYEHRGHTWTFKHLLDNQSRKAEAHIYCDGAPYRDGDLVSNGKVKVFDQLVASLWPSWDLVAMSRFWVQKGQGSWEDVPASDSRKTDRRDVLRELLGLGRLQAVADKAHLLAKDLTAEDLSFLEDQVADRREALAEAEAAHQAEQDVVSKLAKAQEERIDWTRKRDQCREALAGVDAAAKLEERRELEANAEAVDLAIEALNISLGVAQDGADQQAQRLRRVDEEHLVYRRNLGRFNANAANLKKLQGDLAAAMDKVAGKPRPDVEGIRARWKAAKRELVGLEERRTHDRAKEEHITWLKGELTRCERDAGVLGQVPCGDSYPRCPLLVQAHDARDKMPQLRHDLGATEGRHTGTSNRLLQEARRGLDDLAREGKAAGEVDAAWVNIDRLNQDVAAFQKSLGPQPVEPPDIGPLRKAHDVAAATVRDILSQKARAQGKLDGIRSRLAQLPSSDTLAQQLRDAGSQWTAEDLAGLDRNLAAVDARIRKLDLLLVEYRTSHRVAQHVVKRTEGAVERLAEAQARNEANRKRAEGLARIKHAFGPKGIQAVLVDAAGPTVAETATQLLEHAYGWRRWVVEIETTAEKKSGDGLKDVMEATVYDADRDHRGSLDNTSGGERDLLRAALSLGIAQHHTDASGVAWQTAWADEAGAALTRDNAARWIAMLREACARLGVRQLLLVTHDDEVKAGLDRLIAVTELTE